MIDRAGAHRPGRPGLRPAAARESLGPERASEIIDRLTAAAVQMPFQFLHRADPAQLRSFIVDEHPQVIALVLAHMTAGQGLPAALRPAAGPCRPRSRTGSR